MSRRHQIRGKRILNMMPNPAACSERRSPPCLSRGVGGLAAMTPVGMPQPLWAGGVKFTTMTTSATRRLNVYILALLLVVPVRAANTRGHDLFTRAIQNDSTAPNYVLITVVNDKTKKSQL